MRWEGQSVERESARSLPGLAVDRIRTFDVPEALGINFHEVRAKSAMNHLRGDYLPFNHTVNAFRGCSHACTYCLRGDTEVLMGHGRPRAIEDLGVGDVIYGTVREGNYRRYVTTEVLAHWRTLKDAYCVVLEDGTELIASGDHRFWTRRGKWKYVTGADHGPRRRPHLTPNDRLAGVGALAPPPDHSTEYRRGYICGMVRGDGHVGSYSYQRPGRSVDDHHRFRLALADFEALRRTREFLEMAAVETDAFVFQTASGNHRGIRAIRTSARERVNRVRDLIAWPRSPSEAWCKGFLAGIFDAEGCNGKQVVRIANTDPEIIDWTAYSLRRLGFTHRFDRTRNRNGLTNVRVIGGLVERLRFLHMTDPAISRKRSIEGMALKSNARLRVVAVEPLGKRIPMFDITTGTGDFIANGVVSHNCFARASHTYLDLNAGRDFEREIVVKVNVPELLAAELRRPSWKRELVAFGTNTDPYQWAEGRYELMPPMLDALRETMTPASILTKSPLVLRDLDRVKALADVAEVSVNFSVPTLEEKAWRATEPHTPHPRKRLEAVARFTEAGIPSGVLIAPLMPGINDAPEQVEEIIELAKQAGAGFVNGIALHLRPGVREVFMSWLASARPDLVERYEQIYSRGAYADPKERARIGRLLKGAPNRGRFERGRRAVASKESRPKAQARSRQGRLF